MLIYLLKFSACLAIFMVFYKLLLERENMHHFKRYYLLAALLLSISVPLVTFIQYVEPMAVESTIPYSQDGIVYSEGEELRTATNYTSLIICSLYGLGVFVFGLKFSLNLLKILKRIKQNPKLKNQSFIYVLLSDLITPHTFFDYIFLNKQTYESQKIPQEVFIHEQTHAEQKHSFDVLLIELLQIVFWFNPLIYSIKKDIKLNHEFLADQAVLKNGIQSSAYQNLLLTFSSNVGEPKLANAINYSSIKKRFTVMNTHTSKQKIWLRSFLLLPLVALTLYGFSETKTIEKRIDDDIIKLEPILSTKEINAVNDTQVKVIQEKATAEEVAEYNKLANYYNSQFKDQQLIKLSDLKRLNVIYAKMSKDQKANAEPFPDFPPPPPPLPAELKESPQIVQMHDIPPPPPIPANATKQQKKKYQIAIDNYNSQKQGYIYKHKNKDGKIVDVIVVPDPNEMPPPPPPPRSPLDHVKEMAKKGASFYYENKSISSDDAIQLLQENKDLNISTKEMDSNEPIVYISKEPNVIKKQRKSDEAVMLNGRRSNDNMYTLTKAEVSNVELSIDKGTITDFKFKIPGKPTVSVKGNRLSEEAKLLLEFVNSGDALQLFIIKNSDNAVHSPILIEVK